MRFRINYTQVLSQTHEIEEIADNLLLQLKKMTQLEQYCHSVWKGEASDVFLSKLKILHDEMNQTTQQIFTLASTIQYCANQIQHEDQEAERRASLLKIGI